MKLQLNDEFNFKLKTIVKKTVVYSLMLGGIFYGACKSGEKHYANLQSSYEIENDIDVSGNDIEAIDIVDESTPTANTIPDISYNDISENDINYNDISDNDVEDTRKVVAITFDDGPGKYTDRLLDILKENDCKATFFVLGCNFKRYGDAVTREYNEGHEVGIHGYSHKFYTNKDRNTGEELGLGLEGTREEIVATYNLLRELYVEPSNIVRPPGGKITNEIIENLNYSFILWSVDTRDWQSRNKDKIKKEILNNIEEGSIILLHDIHECSVDAIEEILPELTKEYKFVTVSELFNELNNDLETCTAYKKVKVLEKSK